MIKLFNLNFFLILLSITALHGSILLIPVKKELKKNEKDLEKIEITLSHIKENKEILNENNENIVETKKNTEIVNKKITELPKKKIIKKLKTTPISKDSNKTHPQTPAQEGAFINSEIKNENEEALKKSEKSEHFQLQNKSEIDEKISKNNSIDILNIKNSYISAIHFEIQKNRFYPKKAQRLRKEGIVWLSFTILKSGKVENITLKKSSGEEILDKSAIELINKIGKFSAIPEILNVDNWDFSIPINYNLKNM